MHCQPFIEWRQQGSGRFYKQYMEKDMFNYYIVTNVWGSINNKLGYWSRRAFYDAKDALTYIEKEKKRRIAHKYELIG